MAVVGDGETSFGLAMDQLDASFGAKPKNVIFVVPDGMGPAYVTLARDYRQWMGLSEAALNYSAPDDNQGRLLSRMSNEFVPANLSLQLSFDELLRGSVRTRSWNTLVTDSAASATAYASGVKTYNLGIGVDHNGHAMPTIMEVAKLAGMKIGVVVTSRITHATPAAFTSHVVSRTMESDIAEFQLGLHASLNLDPVDVLMGGGQMFFAGSGRTDGKDLFKLAKEKHGYTVIKTRDEFDNLQKHGGKLPLIASFTPDHMSFNLDRDAALEPSLEEMMVEAIKLLDNPKGYVLLVEASRIDMAGHYNDAAGALQDVLELHRVVARLKENIIDKKDTLMVMMADHETGGTSLAKQIGTAVDYAYFPDKLLNVTNSTEVLGKHLSELQAKYTGPALEKALNDTIFKWIGISSPTAAQMAKLTQASASYLQISEIVSEMCEIGFATHGHTGVDTSLYAFGPGAGKFRGNMDNTEVFARVLSLLGFTKNGKEMRQLRIALKDVTASQKSEL